MSNLMLNQVALALRADGTYEPFSAEAWKFAGQMTLMGMLMVFSVLAILWAVLVLFKVIFAGKTKKAPAEKKAAPAPAAPAEKPATAAPVAPAEDNGQLIAVITAAVAAYRASEGEVGGFRVVSFKRAGGARSWNAKK